MYNSEYFLENETTKFFLGFETQTDYLIWTRRPQLEIVYKKEHLPTKLTLQFRLTSR